MEFTYIYQIKTNFIYLSEKSITMPQLNPQNNQIYITKEVFIEHIRSDINQYYAINSQCLGEGGFGQVFQAKKKKRFIEKTQQETLANSFSTFQNSQREYQIQANPSQIRAIKMIQYEKNSDKERMTNQIEILSYLDHPSILKLYQTIQSKKRLYLVTDLMKGGDLCSVVENRRILNEKNIKVVFKQLIQALNYLHSQNICHRDLKPENILFLNEDCLNIALIDFGLAYCWEQNMRKQLKKTGQNKKIIGTPQYMSPEMLQHNYDEKCDIWAAGVILYELLSKNSPFQGNDQKQTIKNIKDLSYSLQTESLKNISEQAKDLISRILVPEDKRLSILQIISHPWFNDNECSCQKCLSDNNSTKSNFTQKKSIQSLLCEKRQKKFKTVRSEDRVRKESFNTYGKGSQNELENDGYESEDILFDDRPEQLTVEKMEYYCSLSKFEKLMTIYAVSKLSESKTKKYGNEYISIDKNLDGTISIEDLTEYLFEMQRFCDKQKTQQFFNGLTLSQRGYISYTQYLACVLSYRETIKTLKNRKYTLHEDDELDERFTFNCKFSSISVNDDEDFELISDDLIYEFFESLDKDKNGLIGKKDFENLFKVSNILRENIDLIKEIQEKLKQCEKDSDEYRQEWTEDPRKFKRFLSRTYKGEKDGGTTVDFETFKSWVKCPQKLLKKTIL